MHEDQRLQTHTLVTLHFPESKREASILIFHLTFIFIYHFVYFVYFLFINLFIYYFSIFFADN